MGDDVEVETGGQSFSSVPSEHSTLPLHLCENGIHRLTSQLNSPSEHSE